MPSELTEALNGLYAIENEIGRGGMGIVYRARDRKLDRLVAIKVLPPILERDATVRERFLREARTAASLSHPNIVPVYHADEVDGHVFFAMAYIDGESLGARLTEGGTLPHADLVPLLIHVAYALDYAHARSVIHRDVKAENILIDRATGKALLTDFGIARVTDVAPMTATGQVLGTVWYMSPEQVMGEKMDGRSDLYALGVVAFRALSGRFPFECEVPAAILVAHATRLAPPLASITSRIPATLGAIVDRCLAKDPDARYRTGAELAKALEELDRAPVDDAAPFPPTLSETNAQALWRRAAELQNQTGRVARSPITTGSQALATGYAMRDVLGAAAEAGIGDEYMARAAAELGLVSAPAGATPPVRATSSFAVAPRWSWGGAPSTISIEAVVPREAPDADVDAAAEHIRHLLRRRGNVSRFGRSLTWSARGTQRRLDVTITVRGGKTVIHADEHLGGLLGMSLALIGGSYWFSRTLYVSISRDREQQLRRLVERIAEELSG